MANNCTPNVQKAIYDLYTGSSWRAQTGVLDMAFSQANGSEVQAQLIQQNGKNTRYAITYPAEVCTAIADVGEVACTDAGTSVGDTTCTTFDSFDGKSSEWHKINVTQFRDIGSLTITQAVGHGVMQQMQKIKDAIGAVGVAAINTNAGCISTTEATRQLKLVDPQTGKPYPHTITTIENDFADAGYPGSPILLGNRQINYLRNASNRGGVSDTGFNNQNMLDIPAFYDRNIKAGTVDPTTPGYENVFALLPQVFNVLTWSENSGMFASRNAERDWNSIDPMRLVNTDNSSFMHTVLTDPATGMLFDFDIVYDPSCKKFQWKIQSYYKIFLLTPTGCKDSCFNGIIKYDICPWEAPAC